jgi:hypothetical protein
MTSPVSAQVYTQGGGTASSSSFGGTPFQSTYSPGTTNILGPNGPFRIGQEWVNTTTGGVYTLTSISSSNGKVSATWTLLGTNAGTLSTLTGNSGGAISPSSGNVNILAGGLYSFVGSGNTLQLTAAAGSYPISPFIVGISGQAGYQTVQSGINAAHSESVSSGNPQSVYIQPGTYTENLTLFDKVSLIGATGAVDNHYVTIIGTHTPPTSGQIDIYGIFWQGATAIFHSTSSGSTQFNFFNNIMQLTGNGYSFDLANWTGLINGFVYLQLDGSGTNGFLNNATGSSSVVVINSAINLIQSNAVMLINDAATVEWDNMYISIKCQYGGSTVVNLNGGNYFQNTHTFTGSSSGVINLSSFQTGTNAAIVYDSSGDTSIIGCNIISSASPCIQGTGAGTLTLSGMDFIGNSSLANTLTVDWGTSSAGTIIANGSLINASGALPTTTTSGFTYFSSCAGTPTGVPSSVPGSIPIIVDTTDSKLYAYIGGSWKSVTLS